MFFSKSRTKKSHKNNINTGQLSKIDMLSEMGKENGLSICSCIEPLQNMHASSFDITPTIVCMSVKSGMLQTVYVKKSENINSYYVQVKPHDTVLIVSNEFISLPNYISGYVTSRVSNIANGFGHICTTIDPNWRGALLIGLGNPTNRTIKIDVGTSTRYSKNQNKQKIFQKKPLATLTFHYLSQPVIDGKKDYSSMRTDLLRDICYTQRKGLKTFWNKVFHRRQKKFTDYFFEYLSIHEQNMQEFDGWMEFLEEFSVFDSFTPDSNKNSKYGKYASDYIIKENIFNRTKYFFENHKALFGITLSIVLLIVFKKFLSELDVYCALRDMINLFF